MKQDTHEFLRDLTQAHRKTLLGVLAVCGVVMVLLAGALTYTTLYRTRTVLIPPTLTKPVTIGRDYVDTSYLSQLAQYLVWLRFNVTPDNIRAQNAQLLRYALPDEQRHLAAMLDKEAAVIIKDGVTGSFFIEGIRVLPEQGLVVVKGVQQKYVKLRALPPKPKTLRLRFQAPEGLILLASMTRQPEKKE